MAGTPTPEPKPQLGITATIAGLIVAASIIAGFAVTTAATFEDSFEDKDKTEVVEEESPADE